MHNNTEFEEGLTKEIAKTLSVAEITVYKYIEKGLLQEILNNLT